MSGSVPQSRKAIRARLAGQTYDIRVEERDGHFHVHLNEEAFTVHRRPMGEGGLTSLLIDNRPYEVVVERHPSGFSVNVAGSVQDVEILDPLAAMAKRVARKRAGPEMETVAAPMPGLVVSVEVGQGDRVEAGTPLVVVEAMKMQNELSASNPGVVRQVRVEPGQKVDTHQALIVLERA